ncbi:predicted protein [Botrytis cinerea T4]|uniref:Uncharacterized protein n=1 Tax=Botryotinia fuckeliana (strain T4) TaxID=999810 RepID=G2YF89_BOTF4|nr:predicted protein [Botrytis cinerea T4]
MVTIYIWFSFYEKVSIRKCSNRMHCIALQCRNVLSIEGVL